MNEKTIRVLEYNKIIGMLAERAQSSMGKKMCSELVPSINRYEVEESLRETDESIEVVLKWGSLPLGGVKDVSSIIGRAKRGFMLSPLELLSVCDILRCVKGLKSFMKDGTKAEMYPIIAEMVDTLVYIKPLSDAIENAILNEDEVADKASQKLYNLRRQIKSKNSGIRDKLQSMLSSYSKYLQDPIITLRGDRYVIPVKSENKGSVPGLVHDQSSSGSTLFIEPMPVVELNNEIKELLLKEKAEVQRILAELSEKVGEAFDTLTHDNQTIGYLDFLMAKAKFALDIEGTVPDINENGIINLKQARHPLLNTKNVVPIDIRLGESYNALVITGPNTGGKTVTLKTAGLLCMMGMAGLAVPAKSGSMISIFESIYADIGDEQSIEQSLSTFSSHMTNIVDIVEHIGKRSLVLVDELGAGTDPTEGAALAMAILECFYEKGAKIIATTHYSEIKVFAMETKGFENASVEFSIETLRPTYRLLIGIPGKSNAFEISKRLGLNDSIINNAREHVSKEAAKFEDVLQTLQTKTMLVERELEDAQRMKRESERIKKELSEKQYKLTSQRDEVIRKAQEDARDLVKSAKHEADKIVKELIDMKMKSSQTTIIKEAESTRRRLKEKLDNMEVKDKQVLEYQDGMEPVKNVKPGEELYVTTLSKKAIVISGPDSKGLVMVQVGIMKVNVPMDKLFRDRKTKKEAKKTGAGKLMTGKSMSVSSTIDLRGEMVDEAVYNLDKYFDDAFLAGLSQITIIHGKGTGALREGIQSYLKGHRYVKSYRTGDFSEGGSGVTVVEIKR